MFGPSTHLAPASIFRTGGCALDVNSVVRFPFTDWGLCVTVASKARNLDACVARAGSFVAELVPLAMIENFKSVAAASILNRAILSSLFVNLHVFSPLRCPSPLRGWVRAAGRPQVSHLASRLVFAFFPGRSGGGPAHRLTVLNIYTPNYNCKGVEWG